MVVRYTEFVNFEYFDLINIYFIKTELINIKNKTL